MTWDQRDTVSRLASQDLPCASRLPILCELLESDDVVCAGGCRKSVGASMLPFHRLDRLLFSGNFSNQKSKIAAQAPCTVPCISASNTSTQSPRGMVPLRAGQAFQTMRRAPDLFSKRKPFEETTASRLHRRADWNYIVKSSKLVFRPVACICPCLITV